MNPILHMIWARGGDIGLILVTIAALIRGGAPEKWGAAILVSSWLACFFIDNGQPFQWAVVYIDIITLVAYGVLAVMSRRLWTYVMTASQAVCVAVHFMAVLGPMIRTWAYVTAEGFWGGWALLIILAVGVATAKQTPSRSYPTPVGGPLHHSKETP